MNTLVSVAIAVCTYRRPALLDLILGDLQRQIFSGLASPRLTIFVIDNDDRESARFVANRCAASSPFEIVYVVQPAKGLSSVRNQALECAESFDYLAFVDDDERVGPSWLEALMATLMENSARFAIGPVRPLFPVGCPSVFVDSGLFHRQEFTEGQRIGSGNTGNALLDMRFINENRIRFRTEFEQSGGEDTCFFADISNAGGGGAYALAAVAHEPVASERLSLMWLMRRRCRFGTTEVVQAKIGRQRSVVVGMKYICSGTLRILASILMTISVFPFSRGRALKYACAGARGYGYVAGVLGVNVREY